MLEKAYLKTEFGCFEIRGSKLGISSIKIVDRPECPEKDVPATLKDCHEQLQSYFAGELQEFDLKLDWGTASSFNKAVWKVFSMRLCFLNFSYF